MFHTTKPRRVLKLEHKKTTWEGGLNATHQKSFRRKSQTFSNYGKNSVSTDHMSRSMTVSEPSYHFQKNRYVLSRVRNFKITNNGYKNCGDAYEISEMDKQCSLRSSFPISSNRNQSNSGVDISPGHAPCKISVLGSSKVGKTALIRRLLNTEGILEVGKNQDEIMPYTSVKVRLGEKKLNLDFQETDMRMQRYIPRDADAFLLVYSVEDRRSLFNVAQLIRQIRNRYRIGSPIFLIATKLDIGNTSVPREDGKILARLHNCKYIEISFAQKDDFDELLVNIAKQLLYKEEAVLDTVKSDDTCDGQNGIEMSKKSKTPFIKLFSRLFKRKVSRKGSNRIN